MRFRLLVIMGVLIFVSRTIFAGSIGIEVDDDVVPYLAITESLMFGLTDDSNGVQAMFAASLFQSVFGTPFAIAPPVVELVFAAMVIIVEEEEGMQVVGAGDVNEVLQQLRPILYSELGFIRLACDDLTVEQRAKVREAAETSLQHTASIMASIQEPDPDEEVVGVLLAKTRPDVLSEVRQEIDNAMKEVLTAERYARYADLAAGRVAHRKQAAILSLVSQLDVDLCLTLDQREKILNEISSHWNNEWEQWLEWNFEISEIPRILDSIVSPILDESQAAVWKQSPKSESDVDCIMDPEAESRFNDGWWGEVDQMAPVEEGDLDGISF